MPGFPMPYVLTSPNFLGEGLVVQLSFPSVYPCDDTTDDDDDDLIMCTNALLLANSLLEMIRIAGQTSTIPQTRI